MSELTDEARAYLAMLAPHVAEQKAAKLIEQLADDNAQLQVTLNKINGYSGEVDWWKRLAAKCNEFRDKNDRLTKMLELAANGRIGFREFPWRGKTRYGPLICGSPLSVADELYDTPIEALEAAYAEWEKGKENGHSS